MKKTIRLTESELIQIIKKVISEQETQDGIVVKYYEGKPTINGSKISINQTVKGGDKINIPQYGMVELKYPNGGSIVLNKVGENTVPTSVQPTQSDTSMLGDFENVFKKGKGNTRSETGGLRR